MTAVGVDWANRAWVAVVLDERGVVDAFTEPTIAKVEVCARVADILASQSERVGARRNAVFFTPIRAALNSPDHASATASSVRFIGQGISAQAYALRGRILEVDGFLPLASTRVVEGHPEVSFAALAGAPLAHGKHSAAGFVERRRLLASAGIVIPDDALAGLAASGLDDVLDAAALAWTARRVERGEAVSLPDPPEVFSDGIPTAIWV